ncbi:MAG: hypothetical protein QNK11_08580 [Legionella sp.]|nr:hypothetical protein [Legionella sp.]
MLELPRRKAGLSAALGIFLLTFSTQSSSSSCTSSEDEYLKLKCGKDSGENCFYSYTSDDKAATTYVEPNKDKKDCITSTDEVYMGYASNTLSCGEAKANYKFGGQVTDMGAAQCTSDNCQKLYGSTAVCESNQYCIYCHRTNS